MKLVLKDEKVIELDGRIFGLYHDGKFICCITIMKEQVYIANSHNRLTLTEESSDEPKILAGNRQYTEDIIT